MGGSNAKAKGATTLHIKKRAVVRTAKSGAIGERRAQRKKLVLANTNAGKVELPDLTARIATEEDVVGRIFSFDGNTVDAMRTAEGFHLKQGWEFFYKPSTLVRKESIQLGRLVAWINGEEIKGRMRTHQSRSARVILHGLRGSGKSVLLLQAMAWAYQRQWVVITIPNAQDLVIGHTEYEFDPSSNLWLQKVYVSALLKKMLRVNEDALKRLRVTKRHAFRGEVVPEGASLHRLVELGTVDPTYAWDIFSTVLHELELPGRPPVFFSLDNFGQITLPSEYRDTTHTLIHALDLALPSVFVDFLSGKRAFWRGLTIAATSSACPRTPALTHALAGDNPSPFKKIDPRIKPIVEKAQLLEPTPLTRPETRAIMEYYKESGLYLQEVEPTLPEKWVLSSGNPKELLAACARVKY
ncbi:mitochondrial ribosomal death-associated protein 3-domain-containing protein [Peziza echinospora]|nr:mitochondrial ribosomal death-associated protein 3-domain-containing protein [Peziza echinospora]